MIDVNTSYTAFGTEVENLTHGSNRKICSVCDGCGKVRILKFQHYCKLCKSCVQKGKKHSDESKQKISKFHTGKALSAEHKYKLSLAHKGKILSSEHKHNISIANRGRVISKEHRYKISLVHSGKILSRETRNKISNSLFGRYRQEDSPMWNSNLTSEDRQDRRILPEYNEWTFNVKERDKFTCQKCQDNKGGNLISHHILGYIEYPNSRFDLDNGITLCDYCHKEFHHLYGYKYFTDTDFFEWISDANE